MRSVFVVIVAAACSGGKPPPATPAPRPECQRAGRLLEQAAELVADGLIGRALSNAERADQLCSTAATRLVVAERLADLGLDQRAIAAYQRWAESESEAERARAEAAITELRKRPPPVAEVSDEDRESALTLYRDGVNLRLQGQQELALRQLRRSYSLSPHPLTIVQIGLTHEVGGQEIEARKAYARALAIAEETRGVAAVPLIHSGHSDFVLAVAVSPDGWLLATGSRDGVIKVWQPATGREISSMTIARERVRTLAFSGDGTRLAAGTTSGTITIFDVASSQLLRSWPTDDWVHRLLFLPNGQLVSAHARNLIRVWDVRAGRELRALSGHGNEVFGLALSPDGETLASGSGDHTVRLWRVADWSELAVLEGHRLAIYAVGFSPDGQLLASGDRYGEVHLWRVATGEHLGLFARVQGSVEELVFSPDGSQLLFAGGDSTARIFDLEDRRELHVLRGHTRGITAMAISPDGRWVATGAEDSTAKLWDVDSGLELRTLTSSGERAFSIAFDPLGRQLAAAIDEGGIRIWDLRGQPPRTLPMGSAGSCAVAYDHRGAYLAATGADFKLHLWQVADGAEVRTIEADYQACWGLGFSPDDRTLAAGDRGLIHLWDVARGVRRGLLRALGRAVSILVYSADGKWLAASMGRGIELFDGETEKYVRTLGGHEEGAWSLAISPDSQLLASGGKEPAILIHRLSSGELVKSLSGHEGTISALAFNRAGTLASGGWDRTIRLWDPATGKELHRLDGHRGVVTAVAFDESGELLASAGLDATIKLWRSDGVALATLFSTTGNTWLVLAADGRVDGGGDSPRDLLYWQVGEVQLPGFVGWQRQQTPRLLETIVDSVPR